MNSVLFSDDSYLVMELQKFKFWCFPAPNRHKSIKSIFGLVSCKVLELKNIMNYAAYSNQKMYIHLSAYLLYNL